MQFLAAAGLVMFLTGLAAHYATGRGLNAFFLANVLLGPLLLTVSGIVQLRRFRGFTGALSRRIVVRWALILAGVIVASGGVDLLARRSTLALDLSFDREYTLSEQTLQACARLEREHAQRVDLLFFEDTHLSRQIAPLIHAYEAACSRVDARELPMAEAPPAAQQILNRFETTVVGCIGDRCEPVGFPSEENITNALVRLSRRSQIIAYFLLGHGEVDLANESQHGFSAFAGALRAEGLEARGWVGPAHEDLPGDASLLIAANPERDLLPGEMDALERFLARGGRLLALLEPAVTSNLDLVLERWGFGLPPGVVVDEATSPLLEEARPVSLLVNGFGTHAITDPLSARTMLLLPTARPVFPRRKPEPEDRLVGLVYSSRNAWIETDVPAALAGRRIASDEDETAGREIPIAAAGRYPRGERETRIVVIGDRDLASNRLIGALYNRDLLMNSVLWLAEDESRITIRPKLWTPFQHPLTVQQTLAYFYFLAFALPEVLLLLGIHAWYRQRQ